MSGKKKGKDEKDHSWTAVAALAGAAAVGVLGGAAWLASKVFSDSEKEEEQRAHAPVPSGSSSALGSADRSRSSLAEVKLPVWSCLPAPVETEVASPHVGFGGPAVDFVARTRLAEGVLAFLTGPCEEQPSYHAAALALNSSPNTDKVRAGDIFVDPARIDGLSYKPHRTFCETLCQWGFLPSSRGAVAHFLAFTVTRNPAGSPAVYPLDWKEASLLVFVPASDSHSRAPWVCHRELAVAEDEQLAVWQLIVEDALQHAIAPTAAGAIHGGEEGNGS